MTRAPERSPAALHDIGDALRVLRASGHRVSAPARVVLEALFTADGPMSAEDIAGLTHPELDVSSVYRNLERLQLLGVVSHIHPGHGPGLYSIVRGQDLEYLACDRCHSLTPLEPEQLDAIREQLHASFGHHAAFSHFPIHGVCADCAAREGDAHVHGRHHHHHSRQPPKPRSTDEFRGLGRSTRTYAIEPPSGGPP